MNNQEISIVTDISQDNLLTLSPIKIDDTYAKEWNEHMKDFVVLTKNGILLRPTLYRVGGLGKPKLNEDKCFMILKYIEAYYDKKILDMSKSKDAKHLAGCWCILNKNGDELITFKQFDSPYLISGTSIYSIDNKYYNAETNECYGTSYHIMKSKDYIFLNDEFNDDKEKRGVLKIDKITGKSELFK